MLENALDACKEEKEDGRKIIVRAGMTGGSFCATVDNTFTGSLRYTGDGDLISTKHKGHGLGTQSVKIIAEKYHGICRLESRDGMFFASVMCQRE